MSLCRRLNISTMELALITARQVIELFILIFCGLIIGKIKMVDGNGKKMLSDLLIYFVVPFMIISSYMSEYNDEIIRNMGKMLFYSILTIFVGMIVTLVATRIIKKEVRGLVRFATTFSNAAYMGFPLIQAMYGSEGVLYASVYVTVFNIMLWTVGIVFMSGAMSVREL
ncbi:MAG: AEC family transporter, partial [Lachnospira sp.]|nr:AEC family transporter [Lachnospira sp.]